MNIFDKACPLAIILIALLWCERVTAQQPGTKEEVDKLYAAGTKFLLVPDSLIKYAEKGYLMAKEINYDIGEASHLKLKGIYSHRKGNFDQAITEYQNALEIYTAKGDELEMGKVNLNIATSYNSKSDFIAGTKYALAALKGFERTNFLSGQGRVLNLLGIAAFSQRDYRSAKNYFLRYNALVKQAKDTIEIASSYNNLGSAYQKMLKPDSTIYYLNLAGQIHQKKKNLTGLGIVLENIGNVYLDVLQDFPKALSYYQKSVKSFSEVDAKNRLGHAYLNIGITYTKLNDTLQARNYLNRAIRLSKATGDEGTLQSSYENLAELEAGNLKFREAYMNLKTSLGHADSIWGNEKVKAVEDLKAKYDSEKKEMKIRSLNQQNKIQHLEISRRNYLLAIGGFGLLAAIVIAALLYGRQRLRAETRHQSELNKQQDEAARAVLFAEERERQRIAADLHDGVGQLLSTALLSINTLVKKVSLNESEAVYADRSVALITESYDEIRSISHQMMPNALLKSGLVSAIREFLETVTSDQLTVNLSASGLSGPLDEQTETIIYRVLQEAVNNVIKYAQASKLDVQLVNEQGAITLTIEDNGIGFDVAEAMRREGIGLKNIVSRVEFLKGTVEFDSTPGNGALVLVTVPVK